MINAEKKKLQSTSLLKKVSQDFPKLPPDAQRIIAIDRYLRATKVVPFEVACLERKLRKEIVNRMTGTKNKNAIA